MEKQYQITPEFVVVRDLNENAFIPNDHYVSFMGYYRDMAVPDLENEAELNKYIEKFSSMSSQERRKQNPDAREDDEYGALLLYDLPQDEGIKKAKAILKTNRHNIEAQLLIAGWEGDMEKRIDLLAAASDIRNLDYDYKQIHKDKMWWGASHTRPFMRAKLLLAKTYELGGYIDDAVEGYKEIIDMNPPDNLGARFELIRLLYKIGDKKEMVSLVNKYPNEVDEYFSFAAVYAAFMKFGKSSKTEKKIIFSVQSNYYLACAIAKVEADQFTDLLDAPEEEDEKVFDNFETFRDDILPLFKNAELLKYYRKVVKEILDRLDK
jgi:tetratricopeptide (TPR) repeat protein